MFLGSLSAADVETQMLLVQLGFGWKIPRNLAVRFVSLETQGQRVSFACALLLSFYFSESSARFVGMSMEALLSK